MTHNPDAGQHAQRSAAGLTGPVGLELAKAVEQLPGRNALPGGCRYELYDGYRCAVVRRDARIKLWSRSGTDLTDKFPDVQAALGEQSDRDCVLDGELVVWTGERLDFGALQQRMVNSAATVRRRLAPKRPASYVAFISWPAPRVGAASASAGSTSNHLNQSVAANARAAMRSPWCWGVPSVNRLVPELPCVETDDRMIADIAIEHFAERGLRNFAYCGDPRFGWSLGRAEAFRAHARTYGVQASEFSIDASAMRAEERRRLAAWLRALPHPVGVLACYDIAGQEVLEACSLAGLQVPDEVAVLGVDNDDLFCNLTSPPLSSIEPDTLRTGYLAAEILDHMMAGHPETPDVRQIPPLRISTRQSSDIVAIDEPSLAAALRYIRDHSDTALTVQSVVEHTALSRRALEYRFTTMLGRTIHHEITRARMSQVAELLTSTDWILPRIAGRSLG